VTSLSPTPLRRAHDASPAFVAHHAAFADVTGPSPRLALVLAADAHEGPVYRAAEDALYFTTTPRPGPVAGRPRVDIMRLALDGDRFPVGADRLSVVRADANAANGMTGDGDALVVCEQGSLTQAAAVTRLDLVTGRTTTLVDRWLGLRLNSPNDVVVKRDGTIWFTDPTYGDLQGFRPPPQTADHVYRLDPATGALSVVADAFDKPNGLAFSPDERTLYVGDSGATQEPGSAYPDRPHHIKAYTVLGGRLADERLFAVIEPGVPDGLNVDAAGRVYSSSSRGVEVFAPEGTHLGTIAVPGAVNFTFGGRRGDVLFITADDAIWAAVLAPTTPLTPRGPTCP
jgi:gluconolactonase